MNVGVPRGRAAHYRLCKWKIGGLEDWKSICFNAFAWLEGNLSRFCLLRIFGFDGV